MRSTRSRCRPAPRRRLRSVSARRIRCKCTWPTSSPSARASQDCPRSACRAASPVASCRLVCSSRVDRSKRGRCSALRTRTSETRPGGRLHLQPFPPLLPIPPILPMSDPAWVGLSDEELLDIRMCDLGLTIEGTDLEARIAQLNAELDARGLTFRPYYWLSDEWFTPDGIPGIAIPFYLAHARLAKLEFAQMLEVEGSDPIEALRILRHEAGHAIDNAYALRRRPRRRRLFGSPGIEYPEYYTPKPYSKSYVQHLDHWYAQSHPDEDFAETFAVWLDPDSMWPTRYAGWA